ncbi:hypothetical protein HDV00_007868 [Rhizophlyctis rosea]|nr:hypothetical protein HDV00_007868 [Rhizophlyctis rosea]
MPGRKRKADTDSSTNIDQSAVTVTESNLDTVEGLESDEARAAETAPNTPETSEPTKKGKTKKQKTVDANPGKTPKRAEPTVWTDHEKAVARTLIKEHGTHFTKVAQELNIACGKTPIQVK